jgi:hypothetical protein
MNDIPTTSSLEADSSAIPAPETPEQPKLPEYHFEPEKFFKLAKPITTHGKNGIEQLSEIRLRAPLGGDYLEIGVMSKPVWSQGGMALEEDSQKFKKWFTRLSGHDGAAFNQLCMHDLILIRNWLNSQMNDLGN